MIQVNIKASKKDLFCQGMSLYLGATDRELCPVMAILNYLVVRRNSPGPLFHWQNGHYTLQERDLLAVSRKHCHQLATHHKNMLDTVFRLELQQLQQGVISQTNQFRL